MVLTISISSRFVGILHILYINLLMYISASTESVDENDNDNIFWKGSTWFILII